MEREELVRLAGEQALLKKELSTLNGEQNREVNLLRNLGNDIGRNPNWLDEGIALLRRLDERHRATQDGYRKLAELKRQTGID